MASQESESSNVNNIIPDSDSATDSPKLARSELRSQWNDLIIAISKEITASKELRICIRQFVIFAIFILIDYITVHIIGLVSADEIKKLPFYGWMYDWIVSFGSYIVIITRFFSTCIVEIIKGKNRTLAELKEND